jgi:hypothetical protein
MFSSKFFCSYDFTNWSIIGEWDHAYWDDGVWNDSSYYDSVPGNLREFYAIQQKSLEYALSLSADIRSIPFIRVKSGAQFKDIFYRTYENYAFKENPLGIGRMLVPYILLRNSEDTRFSASAGIKRIIHNLFREKVEADADFWEINASMSVTF